MTKLENSDNDKNEKYKIEDEGLADFPKDQNEEATCSKNHEEINLDKDDTDIGQASLDQKNESKKRKKGQIKNKFKETKAELKKDIDDNFSGLDKEFNRDLEKKRKIINIVTAIGIAFSIILIIFFYKKGYMSDPQSLQRAIKKWGLFAPLGFTILQIIQVVIPIIPGGITSVAGVIVFGPWFGFVLNHLGILIGSCINFFLARVYGSALVRVFVEDDKYEKWSSYVNQGNRFKIFFGFAMAMPGMPDDIICLFAGLTNISFKDFFIIYNLTKPFGLVAYSMFFAYIGPIVDYIKTLIK